MCGSHENTDTFTHQMRHDWDVCLSQVTFEENPRRQFLHLLGYDTDELNKKVRQVISV